MDKNDFWGTDSKGSSHSAVKPDNISSSPFIKVTQDIVRNFALQKAYGEQKSNPTENVKETCQEPQIHSSKTKTGHGKKKFRHTASALDLTVPPTDYLVRQNCGVVPWYLEEEGPLRDMLLSDKEVLGITWTI